MNVQDILGLPLKEGMNFIDRNLYRIKIVNTFPPNKEKKFIMQNLKKDPYILRIRKIGGNSLELLVSYF